MQQRTTTLYHPQIKIGESCWHWYHAADDVLMMMMILLMTQMSPLVSLISDILHEYLQSAFDINIHHSICVMFITNPSHDKKISVELIFIMCIKRIASVLFHSQAYKETS